MGKGSLNLEMWFFQSGLVVRWKFFNIKFTKGSKVKTKTFCAR